MLQRAGSGGVVDRLIGVLRLDVPTYEAIEHDKGATSQALIIVVLAAIATGIGAIGSDAAGGFIGGILSAIIGWIVFSVIAYYIGARIFGTSSTSASIGQLLRTLGYARAPQLLTVIAFIPVLGWIIALVAALWTLVTSIIAIRQALDFTLGRAIGTAIIAAIVNGLIYAVFGWIF